MSKVHLSQVLKSKHLTYGTSAGLPSFVPEPCKGCSQWRGSTCHDVNGDPCRHVVDWLNNDFFSKQV